MKVKAGLLTLGFVFLGACAPKVQPRQFEPARTDFGPRSKDTDLRDKLLPSDNLKPELAWSGTVSSATYLNQAENLVEIGRLAGSAGLKQKGLTWIEAFYKAPGTHSVVKLEDSPFVPLAATETQEEVRKNLQEVHGDLDRSRSILREKILALGKSYPWLPNLNGLKAIVIQAEAFTQVLIAQIEFWGLEPIISDGLRAELKRQTTELFTDMEDLADRLYTLKTFAEGMAMVDGVIAKFKVDITGDLQTSLKQGRLIAYDMQHMDSAQSALTLLVDVWRALSPEQREQYFKPESETLYNFLKDQDEEDLECLRTQGCLGGIINGIKKKLFVLPQIDKYGVQRLYTTLNQKTLQYLVTEIENFAGQAINDLPATLADQIDKGLVKKEQDLQNVSVNYYAYVKSLFVDWGPQIMPESKGQLRGFEASTVNVKMSSRDKLAITGSNRVLELTAETAGAGLAANYVLLENTPPGSHQMQLALSQLNKLVALGGYRTENKKLVPAVLSSVEEKNKTLDLRDFSNLQYSYRIPDKILLADGFKVAANAPYEKNFSAAGFAEQLRGLSRMMGFMADWRRGRFEESLGRVLVQDLVHSVQTRALNRFLFPKNMLFSLNLGEAAVVLKNITRPATPVFLLSLNNKTLWADQYGSGSDETAIMAGIVDIKNGQRGNVVQVQDVAKLIGAVGEFLKATEGVEATQGDPLLVPDKNGERALDTLLEARKDLRLLIVALSNFISKKYMGDDGVVKATYFLENTQFANATPLALKVEDQVYAMEGLISAWQVTGIQTYLWSAQEIYYALNKRFFDKQEFFYKNSDGSTLALPERLHALKVLMTLKPTLTVESQNQLEKITTPWLRSLSELP